MKQVTVYILAIMMLSMLYSISPPGLAAGDSWTEKADMQYARCGLATSEVNGKIYAIGGDIWEGVTWHPLSVVEEYGPATDTWMEKDEMPTPRTGLSASSVNGMIYAIGGSSHGEATTSAVEEYDPDADKWKRGRDMPTRREYLLTCAVNGKIYAIGGCKAHETTQYSSDVEEYNPLTDRWTKKADMPTARMYLGGGVVNGKIYAIGGWNGNFLSVVEEYDPVADKWTEKNSKFPVARTGFSTSTVNGKIYAISGWNLASGLMRSVDEYDPTTDTWAKKADIPTARSVLSTCALNGKIYAIGGAHEGDRFSTVEEYTPDGWPFSVSFQGKITTTWGELKAGY